MGIARDAWVVAGLVAVAAMLGLTMLHARHLDRRARGHELTTRIARLRAARRPRSLP